MSGWGFGEDKEQGASIKINGTNVSEYTSEEQIRHFVQALDLEMKKELFEFLKGMHSEEFRVWRRVLSKEIQRHDTESRFPLTRDEVIGVLIKIMSSYNKLHEEDRKILLEMLTTNEVKITLNELGLNAVKVIALNKAVYDVDSADGAVALLYFLYKSSDDRKEIALSGIKFVLEPWKGNPEAAFRLLKLIDEKTEVMNSERQTISEFLNLLDPDFLEIHLGDKLNREIKKLIVERLVYASSKLKWVPKILTVRQAFYKSGLLKR